jgi:hypothetical protein
MIKLDDIEMDKIIDRILTNLETKEITILDEHARKTTIVESK